jgi:starch phosphorylase
MVRHTLVTLGPKVLAGRMVREYVERLYAPAALARHSLSGAAGPGEASYAGARELAQWKARVREGWPGVRVEHVEAEGLAEAQELGSTLTLRVQVSLGRLEPADVEVQVVSGRVDESDAISDAVLLQLKPTGGRDLDGRHRYEGSLELSRTGPFGYTVRVLPVHRFLAAPAELGLIALPAETGGMDAGLLR